jgi:hypothetical protein
MIYCLISNGASYDRLSHTLDRRVAEIIKHNLKRENAEKFR